MATYNLSYDGNGGSPTELSAWEKFLLGAGVPESGCASLVASGAQKGAAVRSWVLANYANRYVPEQVLQVLHLHRQLALTWHREDRQSALSITARETCSRETCSREPCY